eukprot:GHRQ01031270.1.p1 GENE.GHRQ01031270.1~~GHRQ01031270.1.p1  ORF type:complete len:121 (-),score=6.61 GHRQ01031270.1:160-522(-)
MVAHGASLEYHAAAEVITTSEALARAFYEQCAKVRCSCCMQLAVVAVSVCDQLVVLGSAGAAVGPYRRHARPLWSGTGATHAAASICARLEFDMGTEHLMHSYIVLRYPGAVQNRHYAFL